MKHNITIVWWTDGFWKWLAGYILQHFSNQVEVTLTGRNIKKGEDIAQLFWCHFTNDNISAVKNADITIFATPIGFTYQCIKEISPHIKKWSVVADVTSIKESPKKAFHKYCDPSILILPTHPMFGPFVSNISEQIFVLTPEEDVKNDTRYQFFKKHLEKWWASVIETSAQHHDTMMAIVQWLTHYNMFSVARCLQTLWIDIAESMQFMSPIYKIMVSSVWRYIDQNPWLYADIQMNNPIIQDVHESFMNASKEFHTIVKEKDTSTFAQLITESKQHFWNEAQKWQHYTDKIIYLLSKQSEKVQNNIGNHISLIHIYTGKKISGKVKKFEKGYIHITNESHSYHIDEWEIITE